MTGFQHTNDEQESFRSLFDSFKKPVHDYAMAITGDHDAAEDIAQEIFINLWKKRAGLARIENIDHYIFRMVRNECMDFFNKAARDVKLANALKTRMTANSNAAFNQIDYKETISLIDKGLITLSPQRRKIYQLSRHQGLSLEEIAHEMGLSYNTVKNHLVEALRQLRKYLQDHDVSYLTVLMTWILGNFF
ncbi:MAG: RNA polymerase sigma-70 factor [Flavitalea sp.]